MFGVREALSALMYACGDVRVATQLCHSYNTGLDRFELPIVDPYEALDRLAAHGTERTAALDFAIQVMRLEHQPSP
jgi:hypothetical protein